MKASSSENLSKFKQFCSCPPQNSLDKILTLGCFLILSWAVPWSILGEECLPGGNVFGLVILVDSCLLAGALVKAIPIPKLPPLPPLLGMLLAGFALRNIPVVNEATLIDPDWSSALRSLALTVILVKAGLELDASALKKMKGVCVRLTVFPCIVEALTCAVACYLLLGFSWEWGFLLGFVLGAVTPAVIVPSLLVLQEKGFGIDQGIPTLVIAASSFDDVLAISGFSMVLGIAFSTVETQSMESDVTVSTNSETIGLNLTTALPSGGTNGKSAGEIALMILRGPLEMLGGIALGCLLGFILWYIPSAQQRRATRNKTLLVFGVGIVCLFGTQSAGFPGAGALAAIVAPFVASFKWKDTKIPVSDNMGLLWKAFEPLMFGLIGAEITIESMDANTVGLGLAVLFIGLIFRSLTTFGAVGCAGLNLKERIFVCFAWLPKATVQAALGPLALSLARKQNASESVQSTARQVLTIAVLSILITAPLGAAAIGLSGPKLLRRRKVEDAKKMPLEEISGSPRNASVRLMEAESSKRGSDDDRSVVNL